MLSQEALKRKVVMEYLQPRDPQKDVLLDEGLVRGGDGIIRLSVVSEGKTDKEWFEHLGRFNNVVEMREAVGGFPTTNNVRYEIEIIPGFYWNVDRVDPIRIERTTENICKFGERLGLTTPPAEVAFLLWERLNCNQKDWQVGIDSILVLYNLFYVGWGQVAGTSVLGFDLTSAKMWAVKANDYRDYCDEQWPSSFGFALMVEPWAKREF